MLSKVLKKETCANCRICCEFEKADEWEIPVINENLKDWLEEKGVKTININGCVKYDLEFEGNETKFCPFHSKQIGCTLDKENKPFDCKIWPVRIMNNNGKKVLAVAKLCPNFKDDKSKLINLVNEELEEKIKDYIAKNPYLINDLKEDYQVIKEL